MTPGARDALYARAAWLAAFTAVYNLAEGAVSVFFGLEDETLSLFGFGVDSFVEVISGVGVWHMARRIRRNPDRSPDPFERRALRITGTAFYLLAAGLAAGAAASLASGHAPVTTFWGVVVALVSIVTMWALIRAKVRVGRALDSDAILADAACTRTCLYLSFVLLGASLGTEWTGVGGLDAAGALLIAAFALREGREAFGKARGAATCRCAACGCSGETG